MLDGGLRRAGAQRSFQHQRFDFAHLPDHSLDCVAAELLQRSDAFVPVDDQVAARLLDDDDRRLLSTLSQRSDQPPLARWMPHPESFQAAVQLMKLQSHGLEPQYARRRIWSFRALPEVCREAFAEQ